MNTVTISSIGYVFDGVTDLVQTDPELNADGQWQRTIRVLGTPLNSDGLTPVLCVFTVVGETKEAVSITSPQLSF